LAELVPADVVTKTLALPTVPAGVVAVIVVSLTTTKLAVAPPMVTAVAPVKLVPVMVTVVPPDAGPLVAVTLVTVGAGCETVGVGDGVGAGARQYLCHAVPVHVHALPAKE